VAHLRRLSGGVRDWSKERIIMTRRQVVITPEPGRPGRRSIGTLLAALVVLALAVSSVSFALAADGSFTDVPAGQTYYAAISHLASEGIIQGYGDGRFGPNDPVKRQQFAKMIVLTAGYPVSEADVCPFSDVEVSGAGSLFPDNFVAVCAANGVTLGKTATAFDPYSYITRYQVISMVVRAGHDLQPGFLPSPPAGWTATGAWAIDPTHGANAATAEYNGLLNGLELATLDPHGNMTRGEVAQVLHNFLTIYVPTTETTETETTATETTATTAPATMHTLSISVPGGHGTVSCSPDETTFVAGSSVVLTAAPAAGYTFAAWDGDAGGSTNPLAVVIDSSMAIKARFIAIPTPGYESLGGELLSGPAACSGSAGRLDVFVRGPFDLLWQKTYTGGAWNEWHGFLGTSLSSGPAAVTWGLDRIDVIWRGTDWNGYWMYWNGSSWSTPTVFLGPMSPGSPTVASWGPGRLDVFTCRHTAPGEGLYWAYYNGVSWTGWYDLGHPAGVLLDSDPAAVSWGPDRIDVFARGDDSHLWHKCWNGTSWTGWDDLGGALASGPAAASRALWHLDVFALGPGGRVWQRSYDLLDGGWADWAPLSGTTTFDSDPDAASWNSERIDVFVRGTDKALWHKWWNGAAWLP
jgi:hypothetical protein